MDTVNVVITTRLEEVYQRQIADLDGRGRVYDAADLVRAEARGAPEAGVSDRLDSLLGEAEVILTARIPLNLLSRAPKLRWIQFVFAGVDRVAETGLWQSNIIVTNASGIHATPIGEYVLGVMLMFAKKAPLCFANKLEKRWQRFVPSDLRGKTLGVIGLGSIGEEVARLARAFGMRVVPTRRSVGRRELSAMGVDEVFPRSDLLEMLAQCDFAVLSVPLTTETARMIGERELRVMKPSSFLVNISRGGVVDEGVLITALKEGWIAGAGLDVFEREPLPPESELWGMPNVIISPHIAGGSDMHDARATELFCHNLKRYLSGQPLINVVDREKGY